MSISIYLNQERLNNLDYLCERLGEGRSEVIGSLIDEGADKFKSLFPAKDANFEVNTLQMLREIVNSVADVKRAMIENKSNISSNSAKTISARARKKVEK